MYISRWWADSNHKTQFTGPVEDSQHELGQEGCTVLTGKGTTPMEVNPEPGPGLQTSNDESAVFPSFGHIDSWAKGATGQ